MLVLREPYEHSQSSSLLYDKDEHPPNRFYRSKRYVILLYVSCCIRGTRCYNHQVLLSLKLGNVNSMVVIRQCSAWASTPTIHSHSQQEQINGKKEPKVITR